MLLTLIAACTSADPATDPPTSVPTVVNAPPVLDVRFPPAGAIDSPVVAVFGSVTDPEGGPVTVTVEGPGGTLSTAASGAFRVDDVALGSQFDVTLRVIATDADGAITERVIALERGPTLHRPLDVAERPDGSLLYVDGFGVTHIDAVSGARVRVAASSDFRKAAAWGDHTVLTSGNSLMELREPGWDLTELAETEAWPEAIAPAPDGSLLVSMYRAIGRIDAMGGSVDTIWQYNGFTGARHLAVVGDDVFFEGGTPDAFGGLARLNLTTGLTEGLNASFLLEGPVASGGGLWGFSPRTGEVFALDATTGVESFVSALPETLEGLHPTNAGVLVTLSSGDVVRVDSNGSVQPVSGLARGTGPRELTALVHHTPGTLVALAGHLDGETQLVSIDTRTGERRELRSFPFDIHGAAAFGTDLWLLDAASGAIATVPLADLENGAVTVMHGGNGEWHTELATDGTTAWSLWHLGYTDDPIPVAIDLQQGTVERLPTTDVFRAHDGLIFDEATQQLVGVGDDAIYAYDVQTHQAWVLAELESSNWTVERFDDGRAIVGPRYGSARPHQFVDLSTGDLSPFDSSEPRRGLGSYVHTEDGVYELDPGRGAVLAVDPVTGQSVVFSR